MARRWLPGATHPQLGPGTPCATHDDLTATAGQAVTIDVLQNDSAAGAFIGEFSQAEHGQVAITGSSVRYTPDRGYSGLDRFSYSACTVSGACTSAAVDIDVKPAECTIATTTDSEIVTGTSGNDVICVFHAVNDVNAGGGDDIIRIEGPVGRIDSGPGDDIILVDGEQTVALAANDGNDTVDAPRATIIRYTGSTVPSVPSTGPVPLQRDIAYPTITVSLPDAIRMNVAATALVSCTDNLPGVTCPGTVVLDTSSTGRHFASAFAVDAAGNRADTRFIYNVTVNDTVTPTVTGATDRASNSAGWFNSPVTVQWTSIDPNPSSGQPTTPGPITVSIEGATQVIKSEPSCDPANNCAIGTVTVSIDTTPPLITVTGNSGTYGPADTVNITCTASDTLSGLATQQCPTVKVKASALGTGVHNYTATATDRAGNVTTQSFTITVRPQTPLTVVRADYDRQLEDVGFPGAAVELWGTVNRQNRPENASDRDNGQTANRSDEHGNDHTNGKVEVQWEPNGPWGPARLEGARFTASTTYRSTGIRLVTVRYCTTRNGENDRERKPSSGPTTTIPANDCVTDTVTIRTGLTRPIPLVVCQQAISKNRSQATFSYTNPNPVVIVAPRSQNRFQSGPENQGQPVLLKPGVRPETFKIDYTKTIPTWSLYGTTTSTKNVPTC